MNLQEFECPFPNGMANGRLTGPAGQQRQVRGHKKIGSSLRQRRRCRRQQQVLLPPDQQVSIELNPLPPVPILILIVVFLLNRPILVLKSDQGFVGYKSGSSNKLECNKANYEAIQVERGPQGLVYFKGTETKFTHRHSLQRQKKMLLKVKKIIEKNWKKLKKNWKKLKKIEKNWKKLTKIDKNHFKIEKKKFKN